MPLDYSKAISPGDTMYRRDKPENYYYTGKSALNCIESAIKVSGTGREHIKKILDFGCGHGRVLRMIRVAFPDAELTAADVDKEGVDFCSKTFNAVPLYSDTDVNNINLEKEKYHLIWLGSVFTHLNEKLWEKYLRILENSLAYGGFLVFSVHGRIVHHYFKYDLVSDYGLNKKQKKEVLNQYEKNGFGYSDYSNKKGYGISISHPAFVIKKIEKCTGLRVVSLGERVWANHHDIVACYKERPWRTKD